MKRIVIDNKVCTGCHVCVLVCSYVHTGEFNMKRSAISVSTEGMLPGKVSVCQQCQKAPCIDVCPENAIKKYENVILLDREKCSGCGECIKACPFDAIFIDVMDRLARKCDLCGGATRCVEYCAKGAISLKGASNELQ
jgi:carbon-monoxide dehydrogenase iron sulfur subunit